MSDSTATPPDLQAIPVDESRVADHRRDSAHDSATTLAEGAAISDATLRLVDTLSALGDAVIITSFDGTIAVWTSAAESVLGWRHEDVIGRSLISVLDPSPTDVDAAKSTPILSATQWQGAAVVSHRVRGRLTVHLSLAQIALNGSGNSEKGMVLRVRLWPERARALNPDELDPEVLERALEHVDDVVIITSGAPSDPSTARIVYVNEAFERTTGFRREEVIGRTPAILRGPDTDRGASDRIDAAVRERQRVREELLNYTKQGEPLWLDVDVVPVDGPGGTYTQWVAVERDVTSQKGQEVALRAREERLRLALNAVWDGLWDWHVPTGYCYYAPRWYSMIGFVEHALPPHIDTFLDLLHPQDLPRCEQALKDHFDGRTDTYAIEVRLRTADNNWRWVLTRGTVVERDSHERPVRMVGTHTDIAERKQAELALRTSEDRFRTLTMASPLGIFLSDASGECTFATPRMLDLWGLPLDALLGLGFIDYTHPDDRDRVRAEWGSALRAGGELSLEYRVVRPDGGIRWVWERSAPLRDTAGAVSGFVGTVEDISAQKASAEDRRRMEAQMQSTQKLESLGVLAGGIAHDFNNLLVGILGNASVAREEVKRGTSTDELLGDIEIAARRAAELTTQLLAYAGKGRFNVQPLDVSGAVRETSSLLQSAISKRASLELQLTATPPTISADATQVRQVIMNLLTNASDALEDRDGQITLRTGVMIADAGYLAGCLAADGVEAGEFVFVEVADTGIGMDAETMARIFDPFFSTKFTGRGLGLAATLGIVRGHHGALHVQSTPGNGTTFRVLFPALESNIPSSKTPRSLLAVKRKGTILVVDDENSVRDVATRMLQRSGYKVLTAVDGRDGLDMYAKHEQEIVAIVLDVTMPRLNGDEVLVDLRRRGKTVPIVLASGYTAQTIPAMSDDANPPVFVQKPYVTAELLAGIDDALARFISRGQ
jgi:two-component system, cell cycle sensor histidine kinase and response regulator CckA